MLHLLGMNESENPLSLVRVLATRFTDFDWSNPLAMPIGFPVLISTGVCNDVIIHTLYVYNTNFTHAYVKISDSENTVCSFVHKTNISQSGYQEYFHEAAKIASRSSYKTLKFWQLYFHKHLQNL